MKISSGIYKGKSLIVPKSGIKPTSDKVRQAVMNILQNSIKHSHFLDLFCGTGAVGIEALSNGADFTCFIENSSKNYIILKKNLETIVQEKIKYKTIKHNAFQLNSELMEGNTFDIIFADPFYKDLNIYFDELYSSAFPLLRKNGIFILEHGNKENFMDYPFFSSLKNYGDTSLSIFYNGRET